MLWHVCAIQHWPGIAHEDIEADVIAERASNRGSDTWISGGVSNRARSV